jgi:hypothetical protein
VSYTSATACIAAERVWFNAPPRLLARQRRRLRGFVKTLSDP